MGRPSSYTPEMGLAILERLAEGEGLRAICRNPAMPDRRTVQRWVYGADAEHEDFRRQYARARELQADAYFEQSIEIADDARFDWIERQQRGEASIVADHEAIQRSRLRVDTRKWAAGRIAPWKYGDKVQVDQTVQGHVEHDHQHAHDHTLEADAERLAEVLAILAKYPAPAEEEAEPEETRH